jgi:hypothetical protein
LGGLSRPAPTPRRRRDENATDEKSLHLDDAFFPSEEEEDVTTEESDGANGEGSPRAGRL